MNNHIAPFSIVEIAPVRAWIAVLVSYPKLLEYRSLSVHQSFFAFHEGLAGYVPLCFNLFRCHLVFPYKPAEVR